MPLNIGWKQPVVYGLLVILHSQGISKTAEAVGSPTCSNIGQFLGQDSNGRALHSYMSPREDGARSSALDPSRENKSSNHREIKMKINPEHL